VAFKSAPVDLTGTATHSLLKLAEWLRVHDGIDWTWLCSALPGPKNSPVKTQLAFAGSGAIAM